jgi:hypothetical protein
MLHTLIVRRVNDEGQMILSQYLIQVFLNNSNIHKIMEF